MKTFTTACSVWFAPPALVPGIGWGQSSVCRQPSQVIEYGELGDFILGTSFVVHVAAGEGWLAVSAPREGSCSIGMVSL